MVSSVLPALSAVADSVTGPERLAMSKPSECSFASIPLASAVAVVTLARLAAASIVGASPAPKARSEALLIAAVTAASPSPKASVAGAPSAASSSERSLAADESVAVPIAREIRAEPESVPVALNAGAKAVTMLAGSALI